MNASCTEAEYIGITEKQDLEKLLGSKYLQAKIKIFLRMFVKI